MFEHEQMDNQTTVYFTDQLSWYLNEEVENNSELMNQLLHHYIIEGDEESAATKVRQMRLDGLVNSLYEAYDAVFSNMESHNITPTNPAVINWSMKVGLGQDDFATVMKHLSWQVGKVTADDVRELVHPESDEAVVDPFTAEQASQRISE